LWDWIIKHGEVVNPPLSSIIVPAINIYKPIWKGFLASHVKMTEGYPRLTRILSGGTFILAGLQPPPWSLSMSDLFGFLGNCSAIYWKLKWKEARSWIDTYCRHIPRFRSFLVTVCVCVHVSHWKCWNF
jgi:hypothetical protein